MTWRLSARAVDGEFRTVTTVAGATRDEALDAIRASRWLFILAFSPRDWRLEHEETP